MDLESANRQCCRKWHLVRLGALLFLILTCGLLVSSLLNPSRAGALEQAPPIWRATL